VETRPEVIYILFILNELNFVWGASIGPKADLDGCAVLGIY
jgi:hypothetical protein